MRTIVLYVATLAYMIALFNLSYAIVHSTVTLEHGIFMVVALLWLRFEYCLFVRVQSGEQHNRESN